MKQLLIILTILATCAIANLHAQPGSGAAYERVESQRVAFITQRLRLTPDEATRFWPVYNQYRDAMRELREDWERPDMQNLSDADANRLLDQYLQQEHRKLELKKALVGQLKGIVPARKILMLQAAENAFNRELLKRVQAHRSPR